MDQVELRDVSTDERKQLAGEGKALPGGGYPTKTRGDFDNAVQAIGRSGAKGSAEYERTKSYLIRRAKAEGWEDGLPSDWGVTASGNAGNAEPLKEWFTNGGDGKIDWGNPGDFDACVAEASKHMDEDMAKGFCANRHHEATGEWPGKNAHTSSAVEFGDSPGHAFRGNQYTGGGSEDRAADLPGGSRGEKSPAGAHYMGPQERASVQRGDNQIDTNLGRARDLANSIESDRNSDLSAQAVPHNGGVAVKVDGDAEEIYRVLDRDNAGSAQGMRYAVGSEKMIDDPDYRHDLRDKYELQMRDGYKATAYIPVSSGQTASLEERITTLESAVVALASVELAGRRCPSCGGGVADDVKTCQNCGASMKK